MIIKTTNTNNIMKAILEFNLDEVDDSMAHKRCVMSLDMALVLWEMDQHLRSMAKHAPDTMNQETYDTLIKVREKLREEMDERGLMFDNLIK
jgi:hypothetical protein